MAKRVFYSFHCQVARESPPEVLFVPVGGITPQCLAAYAAAGANGFGLRPPSVAVVPFPAPGHHVVARRRP